MFLKILHGSKLTWTDNQSDNDVIASCCGSAAKMPNIKDPACSCIQVEKMSLGRLVSCLAVTCEDEGLYLYKTAYSAHYSAEQQIFVDLRN